MVKVNLDAKDYKGVSREIKKSIDKNNKKVIDYFKQDISKHLKKRVVEFIENGISPVKGKGRFLDYADSYKDKIRKRKLKENKKLRPVNLKLSGKMLRSLKIRGTKEGFTLFFADIKAKYHDTNGIKRNDIPTGKVFRRLLPKAERGESMSDVINQEIEEKLSNFVERNIK